MKKLNQDDFHITNMSLYTLNTGRFRNFLLDIKRIRRPEKISLKWLKGLGYGSSADRSFLKILEQIGFIDEKKVPTDRFRDFQNDITSKTSMAQGIIEGYHILYEVYPEAHNEPPNRIVNQFQTQLNVSEATAKYAETTFRILCEFADFTSPSSIKADTDLPDQLSEKETILESQIKPPIPSTKNGKRDVAININIQISLPVTEDAKVYDKIFEALKKHFFSE